jgi:predicted RNA-binding Zn ribbon-like protein
MKEANNSALSLGSAAYASKRAAALVAVLRNQEQLDDVSLLQRLSKTLKSYGESTDVLPDDLQTLRTVADRLHEVFAASSVEVAATLLNALFNDYAHVPRLSAHADTPWHIHIDSDDHAPWAEWLATSSALALAILLSEKQRVPGGLCASPSCRNPFIDLGKGGGRAYCSPRCATRERVAAYRNNIQSRN